MMVRRCCLTAALTAAAVPIAAAIPNVRGAQQSDLPSANSDIVVTGRKPISEAAARRFVNEVTVEVEGQLARFHQPVCPAVAGLREKPAAEIVARLNSVADLAGARAASPGCDPNLIVMVVPDAKAAVKELRRAGALDGLTDKERRRLLRSKGPVVAFSDNELRNDDGMGMAASTNSTVPGDGPIPTRSPMQKNLSVRAVGLMLRPTLQVTLRTIVILESAPLAGKSTTQVADYAAMWGIGGIRRSDAFAGADTILTLLAPEAPAPQELTSFDKAYLKGLYSSKANVTAAVQAQQIARQMTQVLGSN